MVGQKLSGNGDILSFGESIKMLKLIGTDTVKDMTQMRL